jgi:cellulose synthase/poly-beta-1,6-N-acetylglucosamine synthase-like glycosyltransferase
MPPRFWEILPGALSWLTLATLFVASWYFPLAVAVFIVLYDLHWLLKTLYLFLYLRFSFNLMRNRMQIDWLEKLKKSDKKWEDVYHLVLLPMYKEPIEVVRESLNSLNNINFPKEKILIVLATEARGGSEDADIASKIQDEFKSCFGKFLITSHPADLEGEAPGKGSNETWAIKQALTEIVNPLQLNYAQVLTTVFDIDTRPSPDYFGVLTWEFLHAPHPQNSSYQPIPLFTNNSFKVPVFARLIGFSSSFWQLMQQGRPEQLVTFSSHSIPLQALVDVGFWDRDIVSEDSRIFFQCLNHYQGNWRAVPLYYPVSMDSVTGDDIFSALKNLYKQQRRWAWGIENIRYLGDKFLKNPQISKGRKIFWTWTALEGFHSWSTSSFIIFIFGFLPNALGGPDFHATVFSYNLPLLTGWLTNLSSLGIITSAFFSVILLEPELRLTRFRHLKYVWYALQWALIPFTFLIFSSLPALEAQTRMMLGGKFRLGFWRTPKTKES